jgi:hypothetical protein
MAMIFRSKTDPRFAHGLMNDDEIITLRITVIAGRISVGGINHAFLEAGGSVNEYGAAMHRAVADGWL